MRIARSVIAVAWLGSASIAGAQSYYNPNTNTYQQPRQQYQQPQQYASPGYGSNPNSHQTNGYVRNDGTYVQPHYQTNPNATRLDNYSTQGNYNPYTGQYGTKKAYP